MTDFVLDRPQVIEEPLESTSLYRLANQDVLFEADARANLTDFFWPWTDSTYAKSIKVTISAPREDKIVPMVAHLHPGSMETIMGTDGVIVSKQLAVPLGSSYDRSAIWLLDCQAEGDRLLQVDVEIDWGEPLEQRMVDGLLVAQANPGPPQGIYDQRNADSTRVFGNPEGRPHVAEIDDPQRAILSYYVLINGEIEFQFLLTVSDVGEQVAWNGFLALRDAAKVAEKSSNAWRDYLKAGRLWTPDPELNFLLNTSKIAAVQSMQRVRSGMTPLSRRLKDVPALINAWDIFDPTQSRNLLAHLRRLAEKTDGRLPEILPLRRKDVPAAPGNRVVYTNAIYLQSLAAHLSHRFDADLLEQHYQAVRHIADIIIEHAIVDGHGEGLFAAATLALLKGDNESHTKWLEIATSYEDKRDLERLDDTNKQLEMLSSIAGWGPDSTGVWFFQERFIDNKNDAAEIAGEAIWYSAGLDLNSEPIRCQPQWGAQTEPWPWWALMDLPLNEEMALSLVWDGTVLHANQPVDSSLPVVQHLAIHTSGTDEDSFALEFVFIDKTGDNEETRQSFTPLS